MLENEEPQLLTEVEALLKKRFDKTAASKRRLPSTALSTQSARVNQLVLPDDQRPRMPLTKDKYLVKENDHKIEWERETRKFLRQLSPRTGHRVSASMVYEWATGILVADAMEARLADGGGPATRVRADLRLINEVLRFYFGKPYMTWIAGKKVPNCYRVKPGYHIMRHRPMTLSLWAEYQAGVLNP